MDYRKVLSLICTISKECRSVRIGFGKYSKPDYEFLKGLNIEAEHFVGDSGFFNREILTRLFEIPVVKFRKKKRLSPKDKKFLEYLIKY